MVEKEVMTATQLPFKGVDLKGGYSGLGGEERLCLVSIIRAGDSLMVRCMSLSIPLAYTYSTYTFTTKPHYNKECIRTLVPSAAIGKILIRT